MTTTALPAIDAPVSLPPAIFERELDLAGAADFEALLDLDHCVPSGYLPAAAQIAREGRDR